MRECVNLENVGQVEELLQMTEQMQDELDQKDQMIMELNRQLNRSLTLNEKLNSENRVENIEALRTRLRKIEEQLANETDSRKRADAEVVAWKFRYEKAEQAKRYAQTHQKTTEVAVEKKVPYEKCDNCDRTAYQKAKEKCDNRKIQLEKKYKNMTAGYESILFLLAWYSIAITLFTAILSPVFFSDCISFFSMFAKGILSLFQKFVAGADSFGQLSSGISNSIISGIVYWLIVSIVMGILFIITGLLIIGTGYQVGYFPALRWTQESHCHEQRGRPVGDRDRDRDPGDGLQRAFPWCVKYSRQQTGRHLQRRNCAVLCKHPRTYAR